MSSGGGEGGGGIGIGIPGESLAYLWFSLGGGGSYSWAVGVTRYSSIMVRLGSLGIVVGGRWILASGYLDMGY